MSYEGYVQAICENGHYFEFDCYDYTECCPVCQGEIPWRNGVDETNCDSYGEIPMELLIEKFRIKEAILETCTQCRHTEEVAPDLFRVPTDEETRPLRHHRPGYGGTPLVPLNEDED